MITSTTTFLTLVAYSSIVFAPQPTVSAVDAATSSNSSGEEQIEHCKDGRRKCYNKSKCIRNRKINPLHGDYSYDCDCSSSLTSTSFAGAECEYAATVYCDNAKDDEFCTNGGTCGSYILGGNYYMGCHCPAEYSGAHCQYLKEVIVKNNGGGVGGEALVLDIDDNFYTKNIPNNLGSGNGVPSSTSSNTYYNIPVDISGNDAIKLAMISTDEEGGSNDAVTAAAAAAAYKVEGREQHSGDHHVTVNESHDTDYTTQTESDQKPTPYVYVKGRVTENVIHAIIDDSTEEIEPFAFNRKKALLSIDMNKHNLFTPGITKIGDHAFRYCRSLQKVTIPSTVVEIGVLAFAGCSSLVEFEVPLYTNIGANAFLGCKSLTSLPLGYTHENGRVAQLTDLVGSLKTMHKMEKLMGELKLS